MRSRREFLKVSGSLAIGSMLLPQLSNAIGIKKVKNIGIQLYAVRKEMLENAAGTLKQLAKIGYKELESARSEKGNYYGLSPKEIKKICKDLGMTLRSGHVHQDAKWKQSIEEAVETGQEYLIISSFPSKGQTADNYKRVAEACNKGGEECKKANLKFGYHNHEYEFETENGQVLYDVLMDNTDPSLVHMELDLGWVVAAGKEPLNYFEKYPGRFPLWHLKDMDLAKNHSTEFGKGQVDIKSILKNAEKSGMKYLFIEQEEYAGAAMDSMKYDFDFLKKLSIN
ncbi:MAG: sugar phosphate isomerase/epimerase family protein [Chitinophagaceae bacterium]